MIIGISGYAGTGKDTLYEQAFKPLGYERRAFADLLKQETASAFGVSVEEINRDKPAWRELLVAWGERRRAQNPNYWVDTVFSDLPDCCVITDVRYPNEAAKIIDHGGLVILLHRPGFGPANKTEMRSVHEIEMHIRPISIYINDGPVERLARYRMAVMR